MPEENMAEIIPEALSPEEYHAFTVFFQTLGKHVIASATDRDGNIIYVNNRFIEVSKYSEGELLGQNHRILKSGHHPPDFFRNLWETVSGGKIWRGEIKNRAKDGTFYWVDASIAPIMGRDGRPEKYVSVRFLITERKAIEEELKKSKAYSDFLEGATILLASSLDYQTVLNNMAELAVPRMADWCVVDLNESAGQHPRLRRVALAHTDPTRRALAESLPENPLRPLGKWGPFNVFSTGQSEFYPEISQDYFSDMASEGTHRNLLEEMGSRSLVRVPIQHRERVLGVITFVFGTSGRTYTPEDVKILEELGRRAGVVIDNVRLYRELQDADRRKDDFIATLAHELRNPLAPLLLRSRILREHLAGKENADPVLKETAEVNERQVKTMARLLDDLLDISRFMRGKITLKKEHMDIGAIILSALETAKPHFDAKHITVLFDAPKEPVWVHADPVRMEQVVVNILNNAAKFNAAGGRVWITMSADPTCAEISIRDNGIGIDADILPNIFDIFIQHEPKTQGGLGIGLALAKNFVEMHGGTLRAKSEGVGKGSEFIVSVPLALLVNHPETKILIVDDNTDAAHALRDYLYYEGYSRIEVAASGREGIAKGVLLEPHIVLMDIRMPEMDGLAAVGEMRKRRAFRETTFVAVTGYGQDEDRKKTEEAGFAYHFTKPLEMDSLLPIIEKSDINKTKSN